MTGTVRARRYAKSLFDLAEELGKQKAVLGDMENLSELFDDSPDFRLFVKSPIINPEKKEEIFNQMLAGDLDELTLNFVLLLTRKGRESDLRNICNAYMAIYRKSENIKVLRLTTATELPEENIKKIIEKVKSQMDASELETEVIIDPDIIGGFVVEIEDKLFDASVLRDLKDIQKQFALNTYVPNIR